MRRGHRSAPVGINYGPGTLVGCAIGCLVLSLTTVSAHDVPLEQIVTISVSASRSPITVSVRIPTALLADANLPKTETGHLRLDQMEPALRVVAADVANTLAVEQDETPLPVRSSRAVLVVTEPGAQQVFWNQASVDVEITYNAVSQGGLSARVNTFPSRVETVRTVVTYEGANGGARMFSLVGAPERVMFDPDRSDVVRGFVVRSVRTLLDHADWFLFLIVLAVPLRTLREHRPTIAALPGAHAVGVMVGALWRSSAGDLLILVQLVAASAIVIAALQNVAGATIRWRWPLALGFGALAGYAVGRALQNEIVFAGSHVAVALVTSDAIATLCLIWAGAVLWTVAGLLSRLGLPDRAATLLLSIVVAHSAVHAVMDRGELLAQSGRVTGASAVIGLTLAWTLIILAVGIYDAFANAPDVRTVATANGGRS